MESKAFRALMVVALILFVAPEVAGNTWKDWLSHRDEPSLARMYLVTGSIVAAFYALAFIGLVGMYNFKAWGRTISLVTTVVLYAAWGAAILYWQPATGSAGLSQMEAASVFVGQIFSLCWGGVIALAYLSPLKTRFGANNSFTPMPLRGTG